MNCNTVIVLFGLLLMGAGQTISQSSVPLPFHIGQGDHDIKKRTDSLPENFRFIYNCDGDNMFYYADAPMTPEKLQKYIDEIASTRATSLFMSPNIGMPMNFPTKVGDMLGDHVEPELAEQLKPGSKSAIAKVVGNLKNLLESGHDPLALVIKQAHEKKMEVFVSFRPNEVHETEQKNSFLFERFWKAHPEWHIGKHGDSLLPVYKEILGPRTNKIVGGWLPAGLNFAIPEVRAYRLAQLQEICEGYDIDGLEIDFQRFPMYFKQGEERRQTGTMTRWIEEVRKMVVRTGKKKGRPILLTCRVMAKPEQNAAIGLDPFTWAKKGWIDFVTVSHYLHNNFTLPVTEYRKKLPKGFPVYASIEVSKNMDIYKSVATELWKQDINGVYLFNFFTSREGGNPPPFDSIYQVGFPKYLAIVRQQESKNVRDNNDPASGKGQSRKVYYARKRLQTGSVTFRE